MDYNAASVIININICDTATVDIHKSKKYAWYGAGAAGESESRDSAGTTRPALPGTGRQTDADRPW